MTRPNGTATESNGALGGKDGLAEALYREGFARLRRRLIEAVEVAGDDPAVSSYLGLR